VPHFPTNLNYQGQVLEVRPENKNTLRRLTEGDYGPLLISNMDGQLNTPIAVKVSNSYNLTSLFKFAFIEI
jgi:hypothetical protein